MADETRDTEVSQLAEATEAGEVEAPSARVADPADFLVARLAALEQRLAQQEQAHRRQVATLEQRLASLGALAALQTRRPVTDDSQMILRAGDPTALRTPTPVRRTVERQEPDTSLESQGALPTAGHVARPRGRKSRRALLKLGGAAAAATVAAGVLSADRSETVHAASAHPDTVTLLETASGSGNVAIEGSGASGATGVFGLSDSYNGVYGASTSGYGVAGSSGSAAGVIGTSTSGYGVYGSSPGNSGVFGSSTTGPGVYGLSDSNDGLYGASNSSTGVAGLSTNGLGGSFQGGLAPLYLAPAGAPGAPTSGSHFAGEIYLDSAIETWVCIATGTPGTWVRLTSVLNGTSGGALTFLSTPIRLLDTRSGYAAADTPNAPIQPGAIHTFHLPVAGVTYSGVTIPTLARALVGNCTVVNPAGVGDLAAYPDLLPLPNTAVMHYLPGQIVSNGITIGLGSNGKLAITALGSATDVIIDCQGFIA